MPPPAAGLSVTGQNDMMTRDVVTGLEWKVGAATVDWGCVV